MTHTCYFVSPGLAESLTAQCSILNRSPHPLEKWTNRTPVCHVYSVLFFSPDLLAAQSQWHFYQRVPKTHRIGRKNSAAPSWSAFLAYLLQLWRNQIVSAMSAEPFVIAGVPCWLPTWLKRQLRSFFVYYCQQPLPRRCVQGNVTVSLGIRENKKKCHLLDAPKCGTGSFN